MTCGHGPKVTGYLLQEDGETEVILLGHLLVLLGS